MICAQCGFENRAEARYCAGCRALLAAPATVGQVEQVCGQCGEMSRPGAKFCARCGQALDPAGESTIQHCPYCHGVTRPGANFCPHCSQPLTPGAAATPRRLCPRCGRANRPEAHFCQHCSQPLDPVPVAGPPTPGALCPHCGLENRAEARYCQHCGQATRPLTRYETGRLPVNQLLRGHGGDEYLIVRLVARGGMGAIYRVVRTRDQTTWALKEMSETAASTRDVSQTVAAFQREAATLQSLQHENLPQVIDLFESGGRHYMVMEFIRGQTLTGVLRSGVPDEAQLLDWAGQVCRVLDYLHRQEPPIVYRDLKPDNIMIEADTGRVKLIDFGIARRYKGTQSKDTMLLGTPGYAAPEQYGRTQSETDVRADIYALGATLHHLLTGRDPSHTPFKFDPIEQFNPHASPRICQAVLRAVAMRPAERFQTVTDFYEALLGRPLHTPPEEPPLAEEPRRRGLRRLFGR